MGLNFHSARHSDEQMTLGKSLGTNWWHIWKLFHIWEWKIRVPSPNATSNLRDSMVFWNSWGSRSILIQLKIWFNFKGKFRAHPLLTLKSIEFLLTLSRRRPLSYRNQSIHLLRKSMDWFLYDNSIRLERVKNMKTTLILFFANILNYVNQKRIQDSRKCLRWSTFQQ